MDDAVARAVADLPAADFLARLVPLDPPTRLAALRARFRFDIGGFLKYTLPKLYPRPWNRFHRDVLARPKLRASDRRGRNRYRADAAPRGIAKTTLLKGEMVHDVCYGLEEFVVVLSAETRLARSITRHLFRVFSAPTGKLHELYGPFVVDGGVDAFRVTTPDGHITGFLARSFGTQVRGANEDGPRPTKIVIDDGERPDRVRNPEQRAIWMDFLQSDILNAGPIEGGLVVDWRGTVLHPDSTLANLLKAPGWAGTLYRACEAWPERADLWQACGRVFADLDLGDVDARFDAAQAYYETNRAEMDRGAAMLDEHALDLFAFYVEIWTKGLGYVMRERQNEPRDPTRSFFIPENFRRCTVERTGIRDDKGVFHPWASLDCAIWHDRAKGTANGDFPATACVFRSREGWRFVGHVDLTREPTSGQRARVWRAWERFRGCRTIVVGCDDTAQTEIFAGESWERDRETRRKDGQPWNIEIRSVTLSDDKNARIASLEPDCLNGWLSFAADLPNHVWEQFRDFPTASHDDAPDAIERANWLLTGRVSHVTSYPRG